MKVRSQTFVGRPAVAWAAACELGRQKLNQGYTTVLILTASSQLAKRYDLPANGVMVRYWGKPSPARKPKNA